MSFSERFSNVSLRSISSRKAALKHEYPIFSSRNNIEEHNSQLNPTRFHIALRPHIRRNQHRRCRSPRTNAKLTRRRNRNYSETENYRWKLQIERKHPSPPAVSKTNKPTQLNRQRNIYLPTYPRSIYLTINGKIADSRITVTKIAN